MIVMAEQFRTRVAAEDATDTRPTCDYCGRRYERRTGGQRFCTQVCCDRERRARAAERRQT